MKHLVLFRGRHGISATRRSAIFLFLAMFLLSPYLDLGGAMVNSGIIASLIFFLVFWHLFLKAVVHPSYLLVALPIATLVLFNSLMSLAADFGPVTVFTQLAIKLMFYMAVGFVLAFYLKQFQLSEEQVFKLLLRLTLYVVILNAALALLFFLNQELRVVVESFLYSDDSMNINYAENTRRMRGIASAGGAALSVFHALGIMIAAWLYIFGKTGTVFFVWSCMLIACSMLVIGRSGIVLLLVCFPLLVLLGYLYSNSLQRLRTASMVMLASLAVISLPLLAWLILPRSMFEYAIGFLYGGIEGVKEEGTVAIIISFYQFPHDALKLLFGMGNYSGAFSLAGSADPGYMKTFTALGIPLAAAFYILSVVVAVAFALRKNCGHFFRGFILLLVVAVLVVELKEPFILQNYSARLFWLILGFGVYFWRPGVKSASLTSY